MSHKSDKNEWFAMAKRLNEVNEANGFERPSFENLPIKVMLCVTELDEGVQFTKGEGDEAVEIELADTAIRLLHILETLWPGEWTIRSNLQKPNPWMCFESMVWPVVGALCSAVEAWRHDKPLDVKAYLEDALSLVVMIAATLGCGLTNEIKWKTEKNATRGHLHGKSNPAG